MMKAILLRLSSVVAASIVAGAVAATACNSGDTGPAGSPSPNTTPALSPASTSTRSPSQTAALSALPATPAARRPLALPELAAALRAGGYVVLFRHARTEQPGSPAFTDDSPNLDINDCSTQRPLNDDGRADARAIGVEMARLALPFARVVSSEYCRAKETAMLAFGRDEPLAGLDANAPADTLRSLISTPLAAGTNLAIVAHATGIRAATDLILEEGEAAIIAPDGAGGFTVVARVKPREWTLVR
ncbi:MAG: histidine phosphatase family protein [Chloroflexi bacterium]|nr:histidine phosphatase family protein [Chloroflexota bacterium]